jgi:hypothetical protein
MEKLDCHIWETSPAVGVTLQNLKDKINEMVDEINRLNSELSRIHKDYPDPTSTNPYSTHRHKRT